MLLHDSFQEDESQSFRFLPVINVEFNAILFKIYAFNKVDTIEGRSSVSKFSSINQVRSPSRFNDCGFIAKLAQYIRFSDLFNN